MTVVSWRAGRLKTSRTWRSGRRRGRSGVEQPRRSRRRAGPGDAEVRDRLDDALAAAVGVFTDRARTAFADAAREWARRLDEQAALQMRQAADRFRRCLRTVPSDEDLAAAGSLIARLAAFRGVARGRRTAAR